MANSIKIIPANAEIVMKHYGKRPNVSFKAIAWVDENEVLGISGFFIHNSCLVMFSNMTDELREHHKLSLVKGAYKLLKTVKDTGLPIYAICNKDIKNADKLLKHIGFQQVNDEVYKWHRY